ncbi:Formylglycine-generating enzyme, required for sulfatase activity, contains SUMF1/FGE domain [Paraburkholderia fungorum]|uniref:Formylglycine-generating enzyme, required for sulfatase activity, contains SUMF1/FGE domain n=1 Tax=Paraburkholderia fungorum TaxID=134537 RepID=A0A1H0YXM4_9BURK|nr:SUMF1/EgtB/PvdO family nonheme iron enzyme [Paraburkholderia fungorum]SDQ19606.1 Formylglycine-generating enzyme, required for sulfatase activity, contains SUMF1/FGE domain [Paraburkholderia fungorum]
MSHLSNRAWGKSFKVLATVSLFISHAAFADKVDVNAPADKERLIREITTPSPSKSVWEHISLVLNWGHGKPYDDTVSILDNYFKTLPSPSGDELTALKNRLRKEFVFVDGGEFLMGDFGPELSKEKLPYSANEGAAPAHNVTVDSYSILKHRVTFADFDLYTRANHLPPVGINEAYDLQFRFPDFPAAFVTWQQSRDFCQWAGKIAGLPLDLPTEAQWEYAARSRGEKWVIPSTEVSVSDGKYDVTQMDDIITAKGKGTSPEPAFSRPVGTYGDNRQGISDVFGYGKEWTYDWFDKNYYSHSPQHDPRGPANGVLRSIRYATDSRIHLVIDRSGLAPDSAKSDVGFRCVLNQPVALGQ